MRQPPAQQPRQDSGRKIFPRGGLDIYPDKSMSLTVTDRRIYGVSSFGRRVDFPISAVTSVSASGKRDITLLTPSGKVLFGNFENTDELFQTISKMLVEQQG